MDFIVFILIGSIAIYIAFYFLNWISYELIKKRTLNNKKWDLNICCGKTDGGGINADIVAHSEVDNFVLLNNIYKLPFEDNAFEDILCSHTIEHVDDPLSFHNELQRVGKNITYLVPPIWDISAAFNVLEHKWLFFTIRSKHQGLPKFVSLPFTGYLHKKFGQKIAA